MHRYITIAPQESCLLHKDSCMVCRTVDGIIGTLYWPLNGVNNYAQSVTVCLIVRDQTLKGLDTSPNNHPT